MSWKGRGKTQAPSRPIWRAATKRPTMITEGRVVHYPPPRRSAAGWPRVAAVPALVRLTAAPPPLRRTTCAARLASCAAPIGVNARAGRDAISVSRLQASSFHGQGVRAPSAFPQ